MKDSKTPSRIKKTSGKAVAKTLKFTSFLKSPEDKKRALLISLTCNAVFVLLLLVAFTASRMHNFTVAKFFYQGMQRTCPANPQSKEEVKKSGDTVTTTYYVSTDALESGCARDYLLGAQIDDYRAHPEHAKQEADKLRSLTDQKVLYVLQVKSLENGVLLAPSRVQQ
ncbi:MAG TPA: hypothetical protein VFI74_04710 [Candidatus Saccharimonadales bacterium]|nr:hypothetical protein [Candidatus Saccharimonadales bacterium]